MPAPRVDDIEEAIDHLVDLAQEHGYAGIRLTKPERDKEGRWALKLIRTGVPFAELVGAVKYGMPRVWPYTKGQSFGLKELHENLTKARAMAMKAARRGKILHDTKEMRAMWESFEGGEE